MQDHSRTWLDVLTDGRMFRHWASLVLSFALSWTYFTLLITLFAISLVLIPVLIGIPLMLFTLATIPALARMDRQLMDAVLQIERPPDPGGPNLQGANLGERLGYYLGSSLTWRSLLYLALKLPVGLIALMAAVLIIPPLFVEVLLLGPLTIDMRLLTVRLLRFTAIGLHRANSMVLPSPRKAEKSKRSAASFQTVNGADQDAELYLEDDGEIGFDLPETPGVPQMKKTLRQSRQ